MDFLSLALLAALTGLTSAYLHLCTKLGERK